MVTITQNLQISDSVAAKAKRTWIRKLNQWTFAVTPRGPWGTKRRVRLYLSGNLLKAECSNYYTGEECPACTFGNVCYSVARVIGHLEKRVQRQRSEAA